MAEKDDSFCEHDIEERLRRLDAQIKIPEIPDAQSIFDRAETEKTHLRGFRNARYIATAAAVVLICMSIPLVTAAAKRGFDVGSDGMSVAYYDANFEPQSPESEKSTAAEDDLSETNGGYSGTVAGERSESSEEENCEATESQAAQIEAVLEEYFSGASINDTASREEQKATDSFTDSLSKKRSIDIEISDDSVSIMVYDTSGTSEILSAFWVEGVFQSSGSEGDYYVVSVSKQITQNEFEGGDYMPYIGDAQKGIYTLSAENVYVSEKLTKAVLNMSIEINIEDGSYKIYAALE
ncbi:MAG: hypothetical protein ACI4IW_00675 [Oscillospiraceae bacterium]